MAYGQSDDLADAYKEIRILNERLEEAKTLMLQAALGENVIDSIRTWFEEHFPELTQEPQASKKKW